MRGASAPPPPALRRPTPAPAPAAPRRPDPADLAMVVAASDSLVHAQFRPLREQRPAGPRPDPAAVTLLAQLDRVDDNLRGLRHSLRPR
ncbi:hypothetical protein CLV70_10845 [Pseudosporangium ferrugineum]|uniref:Uncharacterized protein n=2 Tax=Pseudosporangium ferrugineum TaxID=439699 RepID=A0A2T0S4N1_9ACTN|nr:hypothetical protein CLV70_10845 [Pseudosporangium ferrugineum]